MKSISKRLYVDYISFKLEWSVDELTLYLELENKIRSKLKFWMNPEFIVNYEHRVLHNRGKLSKVPPNPREIYNPSDSLILQAKRKGIRKDLWYFNNLEINNRISW